MYLRPFEAAVRDAGLASVMNAYQDLDGIPCAASRWLLTDLLRGEWGFDGTVVSDYFAIKQLERLPPQSSRSWEYAAVTALTAGIDVELPSTECYGDALRAAIERGAVAMADVDEAVRTGARVEAAARPVRAPVRRRRPSRPAHQDQRPDRALRGNWQPRVWCSCATTASSRYVPGSPRSR